MMESIDNPWALLTDTFRRQVKPPNGKTVYDIIAEQKLMGVTVTRRRIGSIMERLVGEGKFNKISCIENGKQVTAYVPVGIESNPSQMAEKVKVAGLGG